jgi:hypothetical protein|nr:MAG TPA: Thymopoietin protein [Caudoviricetes sp.]
MSKKIGIGYSFKEKSLENENKELKAKLAKLEAENKKVKEPTVAELKAKLDELGIEYDKKANKEVLLTLLPQE